MRVLAKACLYLTSAADRDLGCLLRYWTRMVHPRNQRSTSISEIPAIFMSYMTCLAFRISVSSTDKPDFTGHSYKAIGSGLFICGEGLPVLLHFQSGGITIVNRLEGVIMWWSSSKDQAIDLATPCSFVGQIDPISTVTISFFFNASRFLSFYKFKGWVKELIPLLYHLSPILVQFLFYKHREIDQQKRHHIS